MKHDQDKLRLWVSHRAALVDYASGVTGSRAEAEDVVQDAYLRFAPAPRGGIAQPVGYLYRIVRNLALDWVRRRDARGDTLAVEVDMIADTANPERVALDRSDLRVAAGVLDLVSPQARAAFLLHRLDGLPLREVAERLGVSVPTAHRLVRDVLTRVALSLEDCDG